MAQLEEQRIQMVDRQIAARGVHDPAVLAAMREVPRERFVDPSMAEFAYVDTPLPIEQGQTISQPYVVALMLELIGPRPGHRVLEVGTGSGYGAAVLSRVVGEVHTIERHADLARRARERFAALGYDNVRVHEGDGTLGWPDAAPFDGILVTAGGPRPPPALLEQLAIGGSLVIPVGDTPREQTLLRITRRSERDFDHEDLGEVRFVPLVGEQGWGGRPQAIQARRAPSPRAQAAQGVTLLHDLPRVIAEGCQPIDDIERVDLAPLIARIGDARVVCIGEASHGTSEFYRMRARITRELVEHHGFDMVAVEGDWPDAARIDHYARDLSRPPSEWTAFARFPTWMWRNHEVESFVEWLRSFNASIDRPEHRVGFYGLDLYSLYTSMGAVLDYLARVDPESAAVARERYGCLSPWEENPATYGRAALSGGFAGCEAEIVEVLGGLLERRVAYARHGADQLLDAVRNAKLVASAEQYYRAMYYGGARSWNLRDTHMFDTLQAVLAFRGPLSRAVVWAHNSHLGDARGTEMGVRGEHNVGQLCRQEWGDAAYLIGFGTDHGRVAAADGWDGPMRIKAVRPSHVRSYERQCHRASVDAFLLPLRHGTPELRELLHEPRLERAIGVIYRPETELQSHYFQAVLPRQFDEYIWFDRTDAVSPMPARDPGPDLPETWPWGV